MCRALAISDIHGNMNLWNQVKNSFDHKEDYLVCLGDCADRGDDGWAIIKEVLQGVEDGYITYIRGNHEWMLIDALYDYINNDDMNGYNLYLLAQNGGDTTFTDAVNDPKLRDWFEKLKAYTCPYATYTNSNKENIFISHAGISWKQIHWFENDGFVNVDEEIKRALYKDLMWNRQSFNDLYQPNEFTYQVFGHTPIPYLIGIGDFMKDPKPLWTSPDDKGNNHKVNIDCSTYSTYTTMLFDLDDFSYKIFKEEI